MKQITKFKLKMLIPTGIIMWAILFSISFLFDGRIYIKLIATFIMTFIGCIGVWGMEGDEYDPDMMP